MTTITAKVICDSISNEGIRITSLQLRYPRFVHSEFMTHRVFSRNASSSRAIPVQRLIQDVLDDPAMPIYWGKNQKGMQAHEECTEEVKVPGDIHNIYDYIPSRGAWLQARDRAIEIAKGFDAAGYHKQIVNRLLEPFSHINVICTSTKWANFFALRDHHDAQPEIRMLAQAMKKALSESKPQLLGYNEWHLPYIAPDECEVNNAKSWASWGEDLLPKLIKISVARCARVSYLTHDGVKPDGAKDLKLYDRLVGSEPLHASPAEHQATPDRRGGNQIEGFDWYSKSLHGNFHGWIQYRKTLKNEYVNDT